MSLRFRRRIKLLPGVHLNISRSGISTSVGVRGASVTLGKRGTYANTGIPGTGVSWRSRLDSPPSKHAPDIPSHPEAVAQSEASMPLESSVRSHHLHWWKILIFLVMMVLAGATKSNGIIGLFWICCFGYWFFLAVRLAFRKRNV